MFPSLLWPFCLIFSPLSSDKEMLITLKIARKLGQCVANNKMHGLDVIFPFSVIFSNIFRSSMPLCEFFMRGYLDSAQIYLFILRYMHIFAVSQGHESRRQRQRRLCGFFFYFLSCSAGFHVPSASSALTFIRMTRYICSDRPFIIHLIFCVFVMFGFERECMCVCRAPLYEV